LPDGYTEKTLYRWAYTSSRQPSGGRGNDRQVFVVQILAILQLMGEI